MFCISTQGSSNLVFCGLPNPTRVFDVKRLVEDNNYLSQCATFANGNHGWYGPSYIGSIVALDDSDESTPIQNSVFSVMEKIVGMNGNSCGPIRSNSIGLELSSVRGIWVSLQSYSIVHHSTVQSISMYCSQSIHKQTSKAEVGVPS